MLGRSLFGTGIGVLLCLAAGCGGDDEGGKGSTTQAGNGGMGGGSGGKGSGGAMSPVDVQLDGSVQKGPLVLGSSVSLSTVDALGDPTGQVFNTETTDDLGNFSVNLSYQGGVAIEGSGYYYNEVTGDLSASDLTLRAFYNVTTESSQAAYVNMLTHLGYGRVKKLLADAMVAGSAGGAGNAEGGAPGAGGSAEPMASAATIAASVIAQAEGELVLALQIGGTGFDPGASHTALNMIGEDSDADAYLFAVSAILTELARMNADQVGGSVEAHLQELLNTLSADFAETGTLDQNAISYIPSIQQTLDPDRIMDMLRGRLQTVGSGGTVPNLHRVWDSDGDGITNLADNCARVANPEQDLVNDLCRVQRSEFGGSIDAAALGDVTGDGHVDVVMNSGLGLVTRPGDGSGATFGTEIQSTLQFGIHNPFPALLLPRLTDIDGDGALDFVVNGGNSMGSTAVHWGDGAGVFAEPTLVVSTPIDYGAGTVSTLNYYGVLDANGDDKMDFIGSLGNDDKLYLLLNQGDDTWGGALEITLPEVVKIFDLAVADVDADGHEDVAVVSNEQGTSPGGLYMLWGNGSATAPHFTVDSALAGAGTTLTNVAIGDALGTAALDVLINGYSGVSVLPGDGSRTLGTPVAFSTFYGGRMVVGDATGDGINDVVAASYDGIGALIGDGSSLTASVAPIVVSGSMVDQLTTADINADGILDVMACFSSYSGTGPAAGLYLINP